MRKSFFRQLRFVAIYLFALVSFTALASTRSVNINIYGPYPMGFVCEECASDSWLLMYDILGYPCYAMCDACKQVEYLLDENGDPIQRIDSNQ